MEPLKKRRQRVLTLRREQLGPDLIADALLEHGAVRVRGLNLSGPGDLADAALRLGIALTPEREGFVSRAVHGGMLYGSGAWPADQPMCMHHELSYRVEVPRLMLIACTAVPASGGVTGTADAAQVLANLPEDLVERFTRDGWRLTRNYIPDLGVSWREAFGTEDAAEVEAYCRANDIEAAWGRDGSLRTVQRRPAVIRHPLTGERCWFNQVAFLNAWTMEEGVREYLEYEYGRDGLPYDTAFGDGSPIGPEIVDTINAAYDRATAREPWWPGDLLIVDNLQTAHSRESFTGRREVVVGFAEPVRPAEFALAEAAAVLTAAA
jgi:alpha-ketoglutarate-dependent taurine dioxygenase